MDGKKGPPLRSSIAAFSSPLNARTGFSTYPQKTTQCLVHPRGPSITALGSRIGTHLDDYGLTGS